MMSILRGTITLILLALFVWLAIWAFSSRRKAVFDSMARLPLENGENEPIARSDES